MSVVRAVPHERLVLIGIREKCSSLPVFDFNSTSAPEAHKKQESRLYPSSAGKLGLVTSDNA